MEDILELVLSILFAPLESKLEKLLCKTNNIPNKFLRVLLKVALILVPMGLVIGLCSLLSYLFRGYWL